MYLYLFFPEFPPASELSAICATMSFMKLFSGSKKSSNLDQPSSQDNVVTQSRSSTDGAPEDFPHSQDVASQPQRKDNGHKSQKKTSKNENNWIENVPHEDEELAGNIKRMSTRMSVSRSGRFKSKGQQRRSVSDDVYHGRTTTSGGETGRTETSRSISINLHPVPRSRTTVRRRPIIGTSQGQTASGRWSVRRQTASTRPYDVTINSRTILFSPTENAVRDESIIL